MMITPEQILTAFIANALQCFVLSGILIINRQRTIVFRHSIFLGMFLNGIGALLYIMPGLLLWAIATNSIGDTIFLIGVFVSYVVKRKPIRRERIWIVVMFVVFLLSVGVGIAWFYYTQEREIELRLQQEQTQKVDTLKSHVTELKTVLIDSSSARAEQMQTSQQMLHAQTKILLDIQKSVNELKAKQAGNLPRKVRRTATVQTSLIPRTLPDAIFEIDPDRVAPPRPMLKRKY
ncbi:hypothetical protein GCM10028807_63140 [Spirosoma daeguense]